MALRTRPRDTGPTRETVLDVLNRDGCACIRCGRQTVGTRGVDWVIHHRRPRAMGGSHRPDTNEPQNLVGLCTACHEFVESHRADALNMGWLVPQHLDPATVAVLVAHESRWVYLTASAEYSDNPPVEAA